MEVVKISVKVWMNTIFFNALFFGIMGAVYGEIYWLFSVPFIYIGGVVAGLPFLVFTILLVKAASLFPYSASGKVCWIAVVESLFIALFYMSVNYVVRNKFSLNSSLTQCLTGTTIAACWLSLYICRKSFADHTEMSAPANLPTDTK